jgi:hypothetical protein
MKTFGGVDAQINVSLKSAPVWGEWSASRPGRFTPVERVIGTHWIGGWVGPRASPDDMVRVNIRDPTGTWIWTPRVDSRYTDWAPRLSYPMGTGTLSPGAKRPGLEAHHSPPISAEMKKRGSIHSLAPYVVMA